MFYSFYTSFNVPSFDYLVEEMERKEVKNDDDPNRDCRVAAAFIVALMLKHQGADDVTIGINADGGFKGLDNTPVHVAVESWDYVLTINDGYFSISVKANAELVAGFVSLKEEHDAVLAQLKALRG